MKNRKIIYKVTHKESCKSYIGSSTKSLETRKKDHLKKSKKGKSYAFQQAIATYGSEAFKWEQIDTAITIDELAQKEKECIIKYDTKENGYNRDSGGGIKKTVYQYSKGDGKLVGRYNSLQSAGNAVSAVKSTIGKACNGNSKTCKSFVWSYSSTYPTDLKDNRKKVVQQFSLDGTLITEYKSVSEASKLTGRNKTSIAKVCRGERQSCGGFSWKFKK
jgi:group I intron endonuclease